MRILICTTEFGDNAGGLALHCAQLKEIFELLGHDVSVEVLLDLEFPRVVDGGYDSLLADKIRSSYKLKEAIRKHSQNTDLCVSCGGGKTAYYAMHISKELGIPLCTVLCGSDINLAYETADLAFYNSEALRYSTLVVGLSNELIRNAQRFGSNKRCQYFVIPNYFDMHSKDAAGTGLYKERIVFATGASYLNEKKGIGNLLDAFSILVNDMGRNDDLYLFGCIDEDIKEQYLESIKAGNIENHVFLTGYLNRADFHEKMESIDVFIQASPFEGFGNSVAEAVCLDKDILISNTGFIAESLAGGFPDHVMNSLDPVAMASDMRNYAEHVFLRDNREIRHLLGKVLEKQHVLDLWKDALDSINCMRVTEDGSCFAVMFHDIDTDFTGIEYSASGFEILLQTFHAKGLRLCSAHDYFHSPDKSNLIICTFDDAYENVYNKAFPIMTRHGFTATVYVCPDLIGKDNSWNHKDEKKRNHMSEEMLHSLKQAGWEIGSHGLSHYNLMRLSENELERCLTESKHLLDPYAPIESFCYPYGAFNEFIKRKVSLYYDNAFSVTIGGINYGYDKYQITRLTPEDLLKRLER